MTNVKMRANDTLHISSVGPDNIQSGAEFVVSKHISDDLEKRGLATAIEEMPEQEPVAEADEKAAPPLANKAVRAPRNKAV